jgi:membrane dipeptidase
LHLRSPRPFEARSFIHAKAACNDRFSVRENPENTGVAGSAQSSFPNAHAACHGEFPNWQTENRRAKVPDERGGKTIRGFAALTFVLAMALTSPAAADPAADAARLDRILAQTPLIDGHNDLPWELRERFGDKAALVDLQQGAGALMTDIPRLRKGRVGGQFWSVFIPVEIQGPLAVQVTIEQIDLVKSLARRYPADLEMAYSAADVARIHKAGRVASLIGIEGGHQINDSLPVLRQMYALGARYMTLTHTKNTAWADSATDAPVHHGLTPFGREVVREMNRLGMLVDLAHVSEDTMKDAIQTSRAPVIFSHSSARALVDNARNVSDDVLRLVARNGGVVMVNFYPGFDSDARFRWTAQRAAEQARLNAPTFGIDLGQPDKAAADLKRWVGEHPEPPVTISDVADHIEHVRAVAGVDHVGLGSDFDGIPEAVTGLDSVDRFPALLLELMRRGWSDADIAKVAGGNVLRVMTEAERVAARLQAQELPSTATLAQLDGPAARR